jgi:hypothetical protein
MREFKGVGVVRSFLSQKWIRWWCAAGLALTLAGCSAGGPGKAATQDASDVGVLVAPLKIPMPLDKAGHKIDVTFDVPAPPKVSHSTGYFLGLRVLFAPTDPDGKIATIASHPVEVRVTLHRLQNGQEIPVKFWNRVDVSKGHEPSRFEAFSLKDDIAVSSGFFTEYSGAPPGTPNASTRVLRFGSPEQQGPGRYRLRLETLKDVPQLQGFKAFLAFEWAPNR